MLCGTINEVNESSSISHQVDGSCSALDTIPYQYWEYGTVNYEACAGVLGMGMYLHHLSMLWQWVLDSQSVPWASSLSSDSQEYVRKAYKHISSVEVPTRNIPLNYLHTCPNILVLAEPDISSVQIACCQLCAQMNQVVQNCALVLSTQYCCHNIACHNWSFVSWRIRRFGAADIDDGVVRLLLVHYITRR